MSTKFLLSFFLLLIPICSYSQPHVEELWPEWAKVRGKFFASELIGNVSSATIDDIYDNFDQDDLEWIFNYLATQAGSGGTSEDSLDESHEMYLYHNLGTFDLIVSTWNTDPPREQFITDIEKTSLTAIKLSFTDDITEKNFRVVTIRADKGAMVGDGSNTTVIFTHNLESAATINQIAYATGSRDIAITNTQVISSTQTQFQFTDAPAANSFLACSVVADGSEYFGDGTNTNFEISHNLNTYDLISQVYDSSGNLVLTDLALADANTLSVSFASPPSASAYYVIWKAIEPVSSVIATDYSIYEGVGDNTTSDITIPEFVPGYTQLLQNDARQPWILKRTADQTIYWYEEIKDATGDYTIIRPRYKLRDSYLIYYIPNE